MILSASIMCANLGWLAQEVIDLDNAGIDVFHVDIMDGEFVPNLALSKQDLAVVRSNTKKKVDTHLMVKKPETYLPFLAELAVDIVYVHFEAGNTKEHLNSISCFAEAGLAINPETTIEQIEHLLPFVDRLLIMRVFPGFAGQVALPTVEEKIARILSMKRDLIVGIDGAVSSQVVSKWSVSGVEEFVLGTSALFGKSRTYAELLSDLRGDKRPRPLTRHAPSPTRFPTNLGMSWIPTFAFS